MKIKWTQEIHSQNPLVPKYRICLPNQKVKTTFKTLKFLNKFTINQHNKTKLIFVKKIYHLSNPKSITQMTTIMQSKLNLI